MPDLTDLVVTLGDVAECMCIETMPDRSAGSALHGRNPGRTSLSRRIAFGEAEAFESAGFM